jgi:cysteinyl-tRNA synthetase, unknown class
MRGSTTSLKWLVLAILAPLSLAAQAHVLAAENPLAKVRTWMYQIQGLEKRGAVDALAETRYDLLVIEPMTTLRDEQDFNAKAMLDRLHRSRPGRIVLAYIDVGQAEKYRTYWAKDWKPSRGKAKGSPEFLLTADADGWNDSFQVAYWDPRWQKIMADQVQRIVAAGFDGLYLDWVNAYEEDRVVAEAKRQGIEPARAMVDFIAVLRRQARARQPGALVVGQNGEYLLDADRRYLDVIDGIAVEDTWFAGKAGAKWSSPKAGDVANRYKGESSAEARLVQYRKYVAAGKPLFTIDYCVRPENARRVYEQARKADLVPLVSRVSLERITSTPPPWLEGPPSPTTKDHRQGN